MTALGLLNFLVLQWFGVRLRPFHDYALIPKGAKGGRWWAWYAPPKGVPVMWHLVRWIWPLTGWWSPHRWIRMHRGNR